jgi:cysteine desulfurase
VIARIRDRLAISTGAACSSGVETPSHVLRAIGLPENCIDGALRIGIGKFTTDADIETAAQILTEEIVKIRQLLANT